MTQAHQLTSGWLDDPGVGVITTSLHDDQRRAWAGQRGRKAVGVTRAYLMRLSRCITMRPIAARIVRHKRALLRPCRFGSGVTVRAARDASVTGGRVGRCCEMAVRRVSSPSVICQRPALIRTVVVTARNIEIASPSAQPAPAMATAADAWGEAITPTVTSVTTPTPSRPSGQRRRVSHGP